MQSVHWKTASSPRIKKATYGKINIQGYVDCFFFMSRVLLCSFFMKIRMKRCVDAKREYIKGETK